MEPLNRWMSQLLLFDWLLRDFHWFPFLDFEALITSRLLCITENCHCVHSAGWSVRAKATSELQPAWRWPLEMFAHSVRCFFLCSSTLNKQNIYWRSKKSINDWMHWSVYSCRRDTSTRIRICLSLKGCDVTIGYWCWLIKILSLTCLPWTLSS